MGTLSFVRLHKFMLNCLITFVIFSISSSACEITIFDCAQGNAVVARYNNQTMIFDAGRKGFSKFVQYEDATGDDSFSKVTFPYKNNNKAPITHLVRNGVLVSKTTTGNNDFYKRNFKKSFREYVDKDPLKAIFISHPDADHYNLIAEYGLRPQAFILGGYYNAYTKEFKTYLRSLNLPSSKVVKHDERTRGYPYQEKNKSALEFYTKKWVSMASSSFSSPLVGEEAPKVEILSVNQGRGLCKFKNKDSMVVKITYKGKSTLIPGDAEKETWNEIKDGDLRSDFLLISHHGSNTNGSTTLELLKKIQPRACFISAGFEHHHPSSIIINYLLQYFNGTEHRTTSHFVTFFKKKVLQTIVTDAPIFTTIDNGCLKVNLSSEGIKASRNFLPAPDESLSDDQYLTYFENTGKVFTLAELKKNNQGLDPAGAVLEDVYSTSDGNQYFKYGRVYFLLEPITEGIGDLSDCGSDNEADSAGWTSSDEE